MTTLTMSLRSIVMNMIGGERDWKPVVRPGMFTPLQMRKMGPDGKWLYREPSEKETQDYLMAEAW